MAAQECLPSRRARRFGLVVILALIPLAQQPLSAAPQEAGDVGWPLHNFDLENTRFSPLDQIDASNVDRLVPAWSLDVDPDTVGQETPLVVDGVLYFNNGTRLFAVDAGTGRRLWTVEAELPALLTARNADAGGTGGRGPTYGGGRVYATVGALLYAVDAATGRLAESFGGQGAVSMIADAPALKYPDWYPSGVYDPRTFGHRLTAPPLYHDGTVFVATAGSANLIRGGLLIALDAATGAVEWAFATIPQRPADAGWELAKDTWGAGGRWGGGIWTQPAVDAELGMIYFNVANPTPDFYGAERPGLNLFTNSIVALHLETGELAWHFQTVHHDLWDFDFSNGPVLFDRRVDGRRVRGIASFGKHCYAYFLDRATGQPINPIVEMAVPTTTDVPGERPWPTQPIPYTAHGTPQQPLCSVYPVVDDPDEAARARPLFHPFQMNERIIHSPGFAGGATWGSPSFSPRTGLVYALGKNTASSMQVRVAPADSLAPEPTSPGFWESFEPAGRTTMRTTSTLAAYDPVTGEQVWRTELPIGTNTGNLVTAGDLVFQGAGGEFLAFDARTGRQLFRSPVSTVTGSPLTYEVDGKQYVATATGSTLVTFSLPPAPAP